MAAQPTFLQHTGPQPRDTTTRDGLGPPTLNTNRENALQPDLIKTFPQLRLLLLMILLYARLIHKTNKYNTDWDVQYN